MSTSLLDDVWANALDPSYSRETMRRREPSSPRREGRVRAVTALVAAALVGGAAALAVTQAGLTGSTSAATRAALLGQIGRAQQVASGLESTTARLRATTTLVRSQQLAMSSPGARLVRQQAALELATAGIAVTGPGSTVRVTDGPSASAGRVLDTELQAVTNALWAAGADAIAVNGQRLGPGTAIRTAGDTILVGFRPVLSPYAIAAIGDRNALQTGYAASDAAAELAARAQLDGVAVAVTSTAIQHLPAAASATTRLAVPLGGRTP